MLEPTLHPSPKIREVRRRTRRDPQPRFKINLSRQPDAIAGCPEEMIDEKHLARSVQRVVGGFDMQGIEAGYSSLGRHGYHPRSLLSIWVYASQIGMHHSTSVARALKTDAAFRFWWVFDFGVEVARVPPSAWGAVSFSA